MKSYIVALKNRFPGAIVKGGQDSVDAYGMDGEHLCSVVRNGSGQWVCNQSESGASYPFSLAPIPRDCRVWKLHKDGSIQKDDQSEVREPIASKVADKHGLIPSIAELVLAQNPKADVSRISHMMNYADAIAQPK